MFRFIVRFTIFFLLPLFVNARGNVTVGKCFKDLILLRDTGTQMALFYIVAACNFLLLVLNITVLYVVLAFIKPNMFEHRKYIFIMMDNMLISHMPPRVRKVLGCKPCASSVEESAGTEKTNKTSKTNKTATKTAATTSE